jgi:uronate dehydrogenase
MTVLLTGAAGAIGTALRERLPAAGWDVRSFDRVAVDGGIVDRVAIDGGMVDRVAIDGIVGDVTEPADLDAAMAGVTAIVHLAGQPTEAPWPMIRDGNLEGTFQVFEAARRHGVRRVVYASSNHAVGFTPVRPDLPADVAPRPDTLYGVSKVFGEALGRYYVDRYAMEVACLRIGTFAPRPPDRRSLSTWLSPDDCARLVDACLRAPELTYALLWGVSANTRRTWSLDEAVRLGYRPRDDAESYADEVPETDTYPSDALVGGGFTSPGFGIDEVAARG